MRISDWSSDVCSSDLRGRQGLGLSSSQRWTQHPSGLPRAIIARWSTQQRLTTQSRQLGGCGGSGHRTWNECTRTGGWHGGSYMRETGIATFIVADVYECKVRTAMGTGRTVERLTWG